MSLGKLRWRGIEPLTPWFVARYSIQLSYQRKKARPSSRRYGFSSRVFSRSNFLATTEEERKNFLSQFGAHFYAL